MSIRSLSRLGRYGRDNYWLAPFLLVSGWLNESSTPNSGLYTGAAAWPANNLGLYIPFNIPMKWPCDKVAIFVGAQSGNLDLGIFDFNGNKMTSLGTTATPAVGFASFTFPSALLLLPGRYWLAMSCSTTVATFQRNSTVAATWDLQCGIKEQATVVPLPDPITITTATTRAYCPWIGIGKVGFTW